MIYAVASEVPAGCDYITAGKRYEVGEGRGDGSFEFADENGVRYLGLWKGCAHINHGKWHRIETDENGWAYWEPKHDGDAPPDWQDGWEWERPPFFVGNKTAIAPAWLVGKKYRYRPAQQASEQTKTERELADVHAEMMDLRQQVEVLHRRLQDECVEYDQAIERIRQLEALICDTLLDHAD